MASRIRRFVPFVLVVAVLMVAHEVVPHEGIHQALAQVCSALTPLGALPPAVPEWCFAATTGPSTFTQGPNSWLDDWDHGLSHASLGDGYRAFDSQLGAATRHFRHNQHWLMDLH